MRVFVITCGDIATVRAQKERIDEMDIGLILKVAGIGILVSVAVAILNKSGRDEQAMFVTLAGILVAMLMLVEEIGTLFESVRSIFGF